MRAPAIVCLLAMLALVAGGGCRHGQPRKGTLVGIAAGIGFLALIVVYSAARENCREAGGTHCEQQPTP
jgi:hypothetical protein